MYSESVKHSPSPISNMENLMISNFSGNFDRNTMYSNLPNRSSPIIIFFQRLLFFRKAMFIRGKRKGSGITGDVCFEFPGYGKWLTRLSSVDSQSAKVKTKVSFNFQF